MAKILIVEDNEMNRDMLSRRLERKGFDVVMAEDGKVGVDMSKSETPDLILMDLSLPVMDGWEATSTIKADDETRNIPIIVLTAHAMAGDREKALEAGADEYDTKPIEVICTCFKSLFPVTGHGMSCQDNYRYISCFVVCFNSRCCFPSIHDW
jgi:CheY-like chemotaxis protein